jgi:sodium/proline symporter
MNFTLLGFVLYMVMILGIGLLTYKKNKNHSDFFVGGRKLNPWVVAFSERASGESAWLLLGLPGAAYALGFLELWTAMGCVIGIIFYWFAIAKDLRIESEKYGAITLPTFFAARFEKGQAAIRILSTLIIIFFFIFYLSAQINGAGKIMNVTFGIDHLHGMLLGAVVIVFYTMMGGFFAVAWTDLVQGIIMIGTLVILPIAGFIELAEKGITLSGEMAEMQTADGLSLFSFTGGKTGWAAIAVIISGLSWAFGYMGQPHLLTRFMSISSSDKIKVSRRIAIAWAIPAFTGALLIGIIGAALYGQGYFVDIEKIMPLLATTLLPAWLAGILISGAIAAMMSTADSQLLVISSSVIEDFYHQTLGKNVTDKFMLRASRVITVLIGGIGLMIAIWSDKLIFAMVSYAWAGLGSSFGPLLLLLLKWKKVTWQGAIGGLLSGFLTTIIWSEISVLDDIISVRFVSFVVSFLVVWLVSIGTRVK